MSITWAEAQRIRRYLNALEAARRHTHLWTLSTGAGTKTRACGVCGLTQQRRAKSWQTVNTGKAAA